VSFALKLGSTFDDAEAQSHRDIVNEFSDAWVHISTRAKPNYGPIPDPEKPEYGISLVFQWLPRHVMLGMEDAGVSTRDPKLSGMLCDFRYPPKRQDWFRRCSTGEVFQATEINRDGVSGVEIDLVQQGRQIT
jgi:hypothetical protein